MWKQQLFEPFTVCLSLIAKFDGGDLAKKDDVVIPIKYIMTDIPLTIEVIEELMKMWHADLKYFLHVMSAQ